MLSMPVVTLNGPKRAMAPTRLVFWSLGVMAGRVARCRYMIVLLALLPLGACSSIYPDRLAEELATGGRMSLSVVDTPTWQIYRYGRAGQPGLRSRLHVYIEGDGNAYSADGYAQIDPTPFDPTALRLAVVDNSGRPVVWLARPCQYVRDNGVLPCEVDVWTALRFSNQALAAMNAAIDRSKTELGASDVVVIGFSGGGTLAALLAARRSDIAGVITVAAPLDLDVWSDVRKVDRIVGALNPVREVERLKSVWQVHLQAAGDEDVPAPVHESFQRAMTAAGGPAVVVKVQNDAQGNFFRCQRSKHECGWPEIWPSLLGKYGLLPQR